MTVWHNPKNNAETTVATARTAGSTTIVAVDATQFSTVLPFIITAKRSSTILCIFEVTAVSGNNLTISGAIEGTTDVNLNVGDILRQCPTALAITEIQSAVDAILPIQTGQSGKVLSTDGTTTGWVSAGSVAIGSAITSGTAKCVLFVDASSNLNQNATGLTWDDVNHTLVVELNSSPTTIPFQIQDSTGVSVFDLNVYGVSNTFLGKNAGNLTVTGSANTSVGFNSLAGITTGTNNTAIGAYSLISNTTGNENVAVGYAALENNTSGTSNIGIGEFALVSNTTGGYNVAIGFDTLGANTTGNYSIAIGYNALVANTTGGANNAIGGSALISNTTGSHNNAFGVTALTSLTSGNYNIAIGNQALYNLVSGSSNIGIGYGALVLTTSGNNTAIGYNAGAAGTALTTGGNCTFLGTNTGITGGQFDFATAIGVGALATASHQIMLGTSSETVVCPGQLQIPTLADASASNNTLYFGSDHLDGNSDPKLCRKGPSGNVTVIG